MLSARNIISGYGQKVVLRNVSFKIPAAEFVGIIGPNGSGKTTLIRTISGALKISSGSIQFERKEISEMTFKERAQNMAVVSQDFECGYMEVLEYVLLGRIPYYGKFQFFETEKDRTLALKYIDLCGIGKLKHQPMREISSGERQLAVIARALCQQPKLLLLDEPTAHLDITHQLEIMDLIKRLNKELSLTVITVLHDLNLAGEYCDKLILINEGSIYKTGSPDEVLNCHNIEKVYRTSVVVRKNPVSFKPNVLIVSKEVKSEEKEEVSDNVKVGNGIKKGDGEVGYPD